MTEPSSDAITELFEELASLTAHPDVATGAMFGHRTITVRGKACCILFGEALVFKLRGTDHTDALALEGAHLFDPSGADKPMREWVQVPDTHTSEWPRFLEGAVEYLDELTAP